MASKDITITLSIDNMTCVNCEDRIERLLKKEAGIKLAYVKYTNGTAKITYDPEQISLDIIEQMIEQEDYHVKKDQTTNLSKEDKEISEEREEKEDITNLFIGAILIVTLVILIRRFGILNLLYSFPIAREGMGFGMLFLIGLLTSVHCVAMCGGICLTQCAHPDRLQKESSYFHTIRISLRYNLGRVLSYTIIGGVVGAIGSVVRFSGFLQGFVQLLAGIFMIIMGFNLLNLFPKLRKFIPRMPKVFSKFIYGRREKLGPFYIGILNGFMPCGPLQAMQLYALSTGSLWRGALAMFLFSMGTVPLMFTFGALSSILNKKYTVKMMRASAVLVILLGISMFYRGASLSGITLPRIISRNQEESIRIAKIEDGIQRVTTSLSSGSYTPIQVKKGVPVRWMIQAKKENLNGCNNSIVIPKYNIKKDLEVGENVIEFTPSSSGTIPYSCWMGMIRSTIIVVD